MDLTRYQRILTPQQWKVFKMVLSALVDIPGVSDTQLPWLCQLALQECGSAFKEAPVPIQEFAALFSFKPYPEAAKRLQVFEAKLRDDPDFLSVTEFVEADGKGSGKDFRASIKAAYLMYWMQCLRDPHDYYNQAPGENIDAVVVAETYNQASNVTYAKLIERLHRIKGKLWVGRPDNPQFFTRLATPVEYKFYNAGWFDFLHAGMQIRLPHNVTVHVSHGEIKLSEGAEGGSVGKGVFDGLNVLISLFTEPSAIPIAKARALSGIFESSGKTRFGRRFSQHYMSYVRDAEEVDFIAAKYADSQKPENKGLMVGFRGKSWEVNEAISRDPVTGEEDMVDFDCPEFGPKRIPTAFLKEYREDPVGSAMKYEGQPPRAARGLFPFPWKIDECAYDNAMPPVRFEPYLSERTDRNGRRYTYSALRIVEPLLNLEWFQDPGSVDFQLERLTPVDNLPRVFALDPAKTHDHYALVGGYPDWLEEELQARHNMISRPRIDIVIEWIPSRQYPVDFVNVRLILDILVRLFPGTRKVVFDSWNSQSDIDHLVQQGVTAENYPFSLAQQDGLYRNLVEAVDNNLVLYPAGAVPVDLKHLKRDGLKIVSTTDRKHIPDALVMCAAELRSMPPAVARRDIYKAAGAIDRWLRGRVA